MNANSTNSVLTVVLLMSIPVVLRAQELTADAVIHRTHGTETRAKLYRGKNAVRLELAEEGQGATKGTLIIYDQARQVAYFLNPAMKAYTERSGYAAGGPVVSLFVPQKDNPCELLPRLSKGGTCQKIGPERVNGRSTEKWQATQNRGGRTITEYAWVDTDLHIAIKWQDSDQDIGQLENIRFGPQPASLFVLPSDYRKIEMPDRPASSH